MSEGFRDLSTALAHAGMDARDIGMYHRIIELELDYRILMRLDQLAGTWPKAWIAELQKAVDDGDNDKYWQLLENYVANPRELGEEVLQEVLTELRERRMELRHAAKYLEEKSDLSMAEINYRLFSRVEQAALRQSPELAEEFNAALAECDASGFQDPIWRFIKAHVPNWRELLRAITAEVVQEIHENRVRLTHLQLDS